MGIASDALLLFGLDLGEDVELADVAKRLGVEGADEEAFAGRWPGIELVLTGHPSGCPRYFLADAKFLMANRGYPKPVSALPRQSSKATLVALGAKLRGKPKPRFWLVSYSDF